VLSVFFAPVSLLSIYDAFRFNDPLRALGLPSDIAFTSVFLVIFSCRLIFWPRSPLPLKNFVRAALTCLVAILLVLGPTALVLAIAVVHSRGPMSGGAIFVGAFSTFAVLCQIGSVIWLVKYRREV
jgi:hypothetical protein